MYNTKILIVGLGSIGKRHLDNLIFLGYRNLVVVSKKNKPLDKKYENLKFYKYISNIKDKDIKIAFICTPTSFHQKNYFSLVKKNILSFYVEKPLTNTCNNAKLFLEDTELKKTKVYVGYDMRFDIGLNIVKEKINSQELGKALFFNAEVGQYLPSWRKEDYSKSYSSIKKLGGGVMLDLIHELDYLYWLFGSYKSFIGLNKKISDLNINTEDVSLNIIEMNCGVLGTLTLDYLQPKLSRKIKIVFSKGTLIWDYNEGFLTKITLDNTEKIQYKNLTRNERFLTIIDTFLKKILLNEDSTKLVSAKDGFISLQAIELLKKSNLNGKKITT